MVVQLKSLMGNKVTILYISLIHVVETIPTYVCWMVKGAANMIEVMFLQARFYSFIL